MSKDTCYIERLAVREILTSVADEHVHVTEGIIADVDALPITVFAEADRLRTAIKSAIAEGDFRLTAPCILCGYSGPGFYQPATHPCAARADQQTGRDTK